MAQAQEAVDRIKVETPDTSSHGFHTVTMPKNSARDADDVKWCTCDWFFIQAPEGESQPMTEVDLFISTQRIKVLSADTQVCLTNCSENLLDPFTAFCLLKLQRKMTISWER